MLIEGKIDFPPQDAFFLDFYRSNYIWKHKRQYDSALYEYETTAMTWAQVFNAFERQLHERECVHVCFWQRLFSFLQLCLKLTAKLTEFKE